MSVRVRIPAAVAGMTRGGFSVFVCRGGILLGWLVGVGWVGLIVVGCGGVFTGEGIQGLVVDDEDFVGF